VKTGPLQLVVSEGRVEALDLAQFRFVGIEPTEKRYVVVKSKMQYRPTFGAMARHIVECNGTGVSSMDLTQFRFAKVKRPVFPLDQA
jgi:microcystin degradation protein MlrC